jgi:rare lipoprotein A (peptidoglycan hydrolase)
MSDRRIRMIIAGACALITAGAAHAQVGPKAALTASAPISAPSAEQAGFATWYGEDFDGRMTAAGERFDMYGLTAAHPTLPLGSMVEVTDLENGRKVQVRINDRRSVALGDIIVLSKAAAANLGFVHAQRARVSLKPVRAAPVQKAERRGLGAGWLQAAAPSEPETPLLVISDQ